MSALRAPDLNDDAPAAGGFLRVNDFCRLYCCGRSKAYELIRDGVLDARQIGTRTVITRASIEVWAAALPKPRGAPQRFEKQ